MRVSTVTAVVLVTLVCSEMYVAFKMQRPRTRRKPGMIQKPRRPWSRQKPSRIGGSGATHTGRHPRGSRVSRKPKAGAGNSASSTTIGNSPHLAESAPAAPMPNPGMYAGGYPDYGAGMGSLMAMQMVPGMVSSLGEAGNSVARTVLEHRNTGGESDDEDSGNENEKKTNKEKDGKDKDTKEKDKDNKPKNTGRESVRGRVRSG
uniref:Uncharacterized protein n=1 Tax=Rhipicephalus zambeziensis TaxID=60191 RepID=A0A224YKC8_9ACAR